MLFFYFLFFWLINNLSVFISYNLRDNSFNFLNEFLFCIDSFSTSFIVFYIVLFFLSHDLILNKNFSLNTKKDSNFFFLKLKFLSIISRKLTFYTIIYIYKKVKFTLYKWYLSAFYSTKIIFIYVGKKIHVWKPLFKRWSYFGLWAKKNNKN